MKPKPRGRDVCGSNISHPSSTSPNFWKYARKDSSSSPTPPVHSGKPRPTDHRQEQDDGLGNGNDAELLGRQQPSQDRNRDKFQPECARL